MDELTITTTSKSISIPSPSTTSISLTTTLSNDNNNDDNDGDILIYNTINNETIKLFLRYHHHLFHYLDLIERSTDLNILFKIFLYFTYFLIFIIGIVGNILVCWVVYNHQSMRTVTNMFISNLALSDILLCLFAVPFTPLYLLAFKEWIFGSLVCRLVPFVQGMSVYISVLTLMSIAIERYMVIIYPFKKHLTIIHSIIIIIVIWLLAFILTLPYGIFIDLISVPHTVKHHNTDNNNNNKNVISSSSPSPTTTAASISTSSLTISTESTMNYQYLLYQNHYQIDHFYSKNFENFQNHSDKGENSRNSQNNDNLNNLNNMNDDQNSRQPIETLKNLIETLHQRKQKWYCDEVWPNDTLRLTFSIMTTIIQFVVPFIIITFCYTKVFIRLWYRMHNRLCLKSYSSQRQWLEKKRARRTNLMLIFMVVIFVISWLPLNTYNLMEDFYIQIAYWKHSKSLFMTFHLIAMSSTCYNPFLYTWLNDNFRKEFYSIFASLMNRARWFLYRQQTILQKRNILATMNNTNQMIDNVNDLNNDDDINNNNIDNNDNNNNLDGHNDRNLIILKHHQNLFMKNNNNLNVNHTKRKQSAFVGRSALCTTTSTTGGRSFSLSGNLGHSTIMNKASIFTSGRLISKDNLDSTRTTRLNDDFDEYDDDYDDDDYNGESMSITQIDTTTNMVTNLESINEMELQESLFITSLQNGVLASRIIQNNSNSNNNSNKRVDN